MNHLGRMAQDYWAEWLPTRYQTIPDPERFFTGLGEEMAEQVAVTVQARRPPTNLTGPELAGWWANAETMATNQTLTEMAFLDPEPSTTTNPDDLDDQDGWTSNNSDPYRSMMSLHSNELADLQTEIWEANQDPTS